MNREIGKHKGEPTWMLATITWAKFIISKWAGTVLAGSGYISFGPTVPLLRIKVSVTHGSAIDSGPPTSCLALHPRAAQRV